MYLTLIYYYGAVKVDGSPLEPEKMGAPTLKCSVEYSVTRCNVPVLSNRTIFLVLLFSQYARNVHFPLPIYKAKKGWTSYRLQVFKMFPVSKCLVQAFMSDWL